MMKFFTLQSILVICLCLPMVSFAQINPHEGITHKHHTHDLSRVPMVRWKFYAGLGITTYGGEVTGREIIGSNSLFKSIEPRLALNLGAAYKVTDYVFVRAEMGYYKIKGTETKTTSLKRGPNGETYSFKATNVDFAVLGQLNLLPYKYLTNGNNKVVPFLVFGLGFTTSTPRVEMAKGDWQSLKAITDDQVKNKVLPMLPMGFGTLYRFNSQWDIGIEATFRYMIGGGSLDGDSRHGIKTNNLSPDAQAFFANHYYKGRTTVLLDHPKFHDAYSNIQIRVSYTFLGEKYKHLFHQSDINSGRSGGGYNHLLRRHE